MRLIRLALLLLFAAGFAFAQPAARNEPDSLTETSPRMATLEPTARIVLPDLNECSGMAYTGGAFWSHNDSGAEAVLYRSSSLDFAKAETFEVPGAENVDWEDLALLEGDILACDTGDNGRRRESVVVYRVRHVQAAEGKPARVERVATYPIQYPDGAHDCEGAFVIDGKLHLAVKNRGEKVTSLFRLDELKDAKELGGKFNIAVAIGELQLPEGEQITGADYDADTGTVVLLTYTHIYQFKKDKLSGAPAKKTLLAARQCEAICFKGRQLVFANEQRDVFTINDFLAREIDSMLPALGKASLPIVKDSFEIDGTGESWANFRSELALKGRLQDEHLRWLLAGDKLLLKARLRYNGEFQSTRQASSSLGSALLLMFGKSRNLNLSNDDVQIAIGDNGENGIEAWRMDLTGAQVKLSALEGCSIKGSVKKGVFEFEAALDVKKLWGEKIPETFLFNAQSWKLHGEKELQFSGEDVFALFRPYQWGEVGVRAQ